MAAVTSRAIFGFLLADNGFDVWLASTRGPYYSTGHIALTPNDSVLSVSIRG